MLSPYPGCTERKIRKTICFSNYLRFYQAVIIYLHVSMHTMSKQHQSVSIIFFLQNQIRSLCHQNDRFPNISFENSLNSSFLVPAMDGLK